MSSRAGTSRPLRRAASAVLVLGLVAALTGCSSAPSTTSSAGESAASTGTSTGTSTGASASTASPATDSFPLTVEHMYGETTVPAEPRRVVVVGLTEQDILLELGIVPVATTEWYGDQPSAVWPWAQDLLGDAKPTVLTTTDGLQYEKIASLQPDLIVGTNAGMSQEDYTKLSAIAPTVTSVKGSELYFSSWQDQVRQVARAVGRSAAGEDLITGVADAYARAADEHPEFAGLTATFSQGAPYDGNLYVYPAGLGTDFLTDLGFTMTAGLDAYAESTDSQALISAENVPLIDADVVVFATEDESSIQDLMDFGTLADLSAVRENRAVYTDATLAGALYFLTPLSQRYVLDHLVPLLARAVEGTAPRTTTS